MQKNNFKQQQKGFSLVELLTVIVIIAILAAIGSWVYTGATRNAQRTAFKTFYASLQNGLEHYRSDFSEYPVPKNNTTSGSGGGSNALYQAITGDGHNMLDIADTSKMPSECSAESDGKNHGRCGPMYIESLTQSNNQYEFLFSSGATAYFIDIYGDAVNYQVGTDNASTGASHNLTTYDMWATMGQPGVDAAWIKNW